jgi:hypothetical protein
MLTLGERKSSKRIFRVSGAHGSNSSVRLSKARGARRFIIASVDGTELGVGEPYGMLLKSEQKPFRTEGQRGSLINGERTIVGSHSFREELASKREFRAKTMDKQHKEVAV